MKPKISLNNLKNLLAKNAYPVISSQKFLSRCIDGRYLNEKNLPALAIPGADLGELALLMAAANKYGFTLDQKKAFSSLIEIVGGKNNFHFHTDDHHHGLALGCGHWGQIKADPAAYSLEGKDIDFIDRKLEDLMKEGVKQFILKGGHCEVAVLIVKGNFGIYPQFSFQTKEGEKSFSVFIYHEDLADQRRKLLAKKLIENRAVKFALPGKKIILEEVLANEGKIHFRQTINRLAPDLPFLKAIFDRKGRLNLTKANLEG